MKKISPFTSAGVAISSLDNGGSFFNILTKAEDGRIETAELKKLAGRFNNMQQSILFLYMAISRLGPFFRREVYDALSEKLQKAFLKYEPQHLSPSEIKEKGEAGSPVMVEGFATLVESRSDFNGFIMVPITASGSTTMIMIPIIDEYDVYELRTEAGGEPVTIAHNKGYGKLPGGKVMVGGVLKELKEKNDEGSPAGLFLEIQYYHDEFTLA